MFGSRLCPWGFVIKLNHDGRYVSMPGSGKSYTNKLECARVFQTREQAERDKCANEHVVALADLMRGVRTW